MHRLSFLLLSAIVPALLAFGHSNTAATATLPADTIAPDALPAATAAADDVIITGATAMPADSTTAAIVGRLNGLMESAIFDRTQVGLYVYDLTADAPVYAHGEHQQLRPASCQKLLTAITALDCLGTAYLYHTRLYTDGTVADSTLTGNLYLRGGFDPLLDRTDLRAFADSLRSLGVKRLEGAVVFDRSLKDTTLMGWGWCWDDDTTPLTPLLYEGRADLEAHFVSALREAGISCGDATAYAEVPRGARLVADRTHTVDQVLLPMMKRSNNLCAESLFYQIAASTGRLFATRREAARAADRLLSRLGVSSDTYQVADGSGLSLYNYLTPHALVSLLRHAYRDEAIYRHLLPSLPVAGEDGTLRRRMTSGAARGNVCAKTGSLEGVSTLAGYCTAPNGHRLCFAIMNQGVRHGSTGRNFQDRVCRALTEE